MPSFFRAGIESLGGELFLMSTRPFVARIKKDWRYPHRENAYQFADRPPPGFQATEPPDWVTGTICGTVPERPQPDAKSTPSSRCSLTGDLFVD